MTEQEVPKSLSLLKITVEYTITDDGDVLVDKKVSGVNSFINMADINDRIYDLSRIVMKKVDKVGMFSEEEQEIRKEDMRKEVTRRALLKLIQDNKVEYND